MKTGYIVQKIGISLAVVAGFTCGNRLMANDIDYSNLAGTDIVFNGADGFSFSNNGAANPANIKITGSASGAAIGLFGEITGDYTIGAISHVGMTNTADVTGTGTFSIYDGANTLTGTLNWDDIVQVGTGSTLNDQGQVNLTSITYNGSDEDLLDLKNALSASNVLDFTFTPEMSLSSLTSASAQTSFSGTVSTSSAVPDNASTAFLFGLGAVGIVLGMVGQRRKLVSRA